MIVETVFFIDNWTSGQNYRSILNLGKIKKKARTDGIETTKEKGVLVTLNLAMKFLPKMYRKGSVDWIILAYLCDVNESATVL